VVKIGPKRNLNMDVLYGAKEAGKGMPKFFQGLLNHTGGFNAEQAALVVWQNQDAVKFDESFKLRWPVRNHVMFDGC
jgi:hypothetical protein